MKSSSNVRHSRGDGVKNKGIKCPQQQKTPMIPPPVGPQHNRDDYENT